ncbi:MAG: hypothetical protein AB7O98_15025 [Hyphomonadaceae bacterium]
MTLEELSYIGQAVAAVAVLVSLAAVYGQLQQNNKIARADLTHSIWLSAGEMNLSLFDTPEKADLMHRALYGSGPLTDTEKLRMRSVIGVALGIHRAGFNAHKRGLMEDDAYSALEQAARLYLLSPFVQQWWAGAGKSGNDPAYVALMNAMVAEINAKQAGGASAARSKAGESNV